MPCRADWIGLDTPEQTGSDWTREDISQSTANGDAPTGHSLVVAVRHLYTDYRTTCEEIPDSVLGFTPELEYSVSGNGSQE